MPSCHWLWSSPHSLCQRLALWRPWQCPTCLLLHSLSLRELLKRQEMRHLWRQFVDWACVIWFFLPWWLFVKVYDSSVCRKGSYRRRSLRHLMQKMPCFINWIRVAMLFSQPIENVQRCRKSQSPSERPNVSSSYSKTKSIESVLVIFRLSKNVHSAVGNKLLARSAFCISSWMSRARVTCSFNGVVIGHRTCPAVPSLYWTSKSMQGSLHVIEAR